MTGRLRALVCFFCSASETAPIEDETAAARFTEAHGPGACVDE